MWNGLGEYSEARCRPDGFYLGETPGNPSKGDELLELELEAGL